MQMLRRILEIKQGGKANVAKADDWKTRLVRNSPLSNDRGHKNFVADNTRLLNDNQKLLKILTGVRSTKTLKALQLNDEGKKQETYRDMMLNSKLRNASMVTSPSRTGTAIKLSLGQSKLNSPESAYSRGYSAYRRPSLPVTRLV